MNQQLSMYVRRYINTDGTVEQPSVIPVGDVPDFIRDCLRHGSGNRHIDIVPNSGRGVRWTFESVTVEAGG